MLKVHVPHVGWIVFMLVVGAALLLLGLFVTARTVIELANSERAEGRVVGLVRESKERFGSWHVGSSRQRSGGEAPVVEYEAAGQPYRIEGHIFERPPDYRVGDTIGVRYPASDPAKGHIDTVGETWTPPVMITTMGLLTCGLGLFLYRWKRHPGQPKASD